MRRLILMLALTLCAMAPGAAAGLYGYRSPVASAQEAGPGTVCANQRFRALQASDRIPDCRAFEMVTPLDKGGVDVTGTTPFVKAARDGGAIAFLDTLSHSPLQEYTPTLSRRVESAWSGSILFPPQSGNDPDLVGLAPDLSEAFIQVSEPGEESATALISRSAADGALRTLVPYTTGLKPELVGVSEDGSLVVFESRAALPGAGAAISGKPNLYTWDRSNGQVGLVGVFNDGAAPAEGAFGGAYDWVRGTTQSTLGEGGAARDYYTQDQRAVAANGSAAYFTAAGTGQLYLRRNPGAPQSPLDGAGDCASAALACTIRVSASAKTNGAGPAGTDPTGPSPAAFMGASADGVRVFFTSAEELTDDANTGPEPFPPAITRAGIDGDPGSVDPGFLPAAATGIAVDGAHLYWANPLRGSIGRARLDGAGVEEDFIGGVARPRWVAVDDEYVYWTSPGVAEKQGEGTIGRARLDGGGAVEPNFIAGASQPQGIAVNDTKIFWANDGTNAIARANVDGSGIEPKFRFLGGGEVPQGVAVNGSHIYWTVNNPTGYVSRANLDGSREIFRLIGGSDDLRGIAVDDEYVYWSTRSSSVIGRSSLDLSKTEPQFIPEAGRAAGLAADDLHLYWAIAGSIANPGNDLYRYDADLDELVDLTPLPEETNGAEVKGVLGISEDGSSVYFAANGVLAEASNGNGEVPLPGSCKGNIGSASGICNLYVFHAGIVEFIARLEIDGGTAQSDAANWAASPAVSTNPRFQQTARIAPDGHTLLFRSQRQLTTHVNGGIPQLYLYRAGNPDLICISCDPRGGPPVGAPTLGTIATPNAFHKRPAAVLTRNLSGDGDTVFFESLDSLVETDDNGGEGCPRVGFSAQEFPICQDVYQWQAEGTGSCRSATASGGCLFLLSHDNEGEPTLFADASEDGEDVFLFTRASLVALDRDRLVDLYDARVNGGIVEQNETFAPCQGEGCRPPPSDPPVPEILGTAGPLQFTRSRLPRRCSKARRAVRRHHAGKRRCGKRRRSHR